MKRDRNDSGDTSKRRPAKKASGSAAARPAARTRASGTAAAKPAAKPTRTATPKPAPKRGGAKPAGAKPAAAKSAAAKPRPAAAAKPQPPAATPKPVAAKPKAAGPRAAPAKAAASARAKVPRAAAAPRSPRARAANPVAAGTLVGLSEEEQIESAKYLPRDLPPRVFEEERFIFPESYGANRVRLLVKDPQWIFAHWDVDPGLFDGLRSEMGERAAALSRLTLKVTDPEHGGGAVIHLPEGARSWYVRTDRARRAYQAELGLTLPSGEYRLLARSNTVSPPHSGASPRRVTHRGRYVRAEPGAPPAGPQWTEPPAPPSVEAGPGAHAGPEPSAGPGPWRPAPGDVRRGSDQPGTTPGEGAAPEGKGGASDLYRR